jgi:tetratricopeptide (TPR) repeat protein
VALPCPQVAVARRSRRVQGCYSAAVRRYFAAFLALAAVGATSAGVYTAYATDREYARLIAIGDQAARGDEPFQALEAYSGAIALRPESMLAHLKRGRTYRERGDLDRAARDLRRAVELDPTATLALELLGDTFLSMQRHDRAAERYRAYLALDDRSPQVWYKLGLALYRGGQMADATSPLQRAIALDGQSAEAQFVLGLCYRDQGDRGLARAAFETAVRTSPGLAAPREALAALYADSGDMSRSIDQLEALAALDPARPDRFVAIGLAHARARRHEAAVLTLSRAVERFPTDPGVYGALGRVWLDMADTRDDPVALKKALEALSTAAAHNDVTSETLTHLGRARMMAGDAVAAERALSRATARTPVEPDAYQHLATLTARSGRLQEARDALIKYAALVGDMRPLAAIATQIAAYSVRLGDSPTALHWIDRAVDEAGDTPALTDLRRRALALRNSH